MDALLVYSICFGLAKCRGVKRTAAHAELKRPTDLQRSQGKDRSRRRRGSVQSRAAISADELGRLIFPIAPTRSNISVRSSEDGAKHFDA